MASFGSYHLDKLADGKALSSCEIESFPYALFWLDKNVNVSINMVRPEKKVAHWLRVTQKQICLAFQNLADYPLGYEMCCSNAAVSVEGPAHCHGKAVGIAHEIKIQVSGDFANGVGAVWEEPRCFSDWEVFLVAILFACASENKMLKVVH